MLDSWDEAAAASRISLQRRIPPLVRLWASESATALLADGTRRGSRDQGASGTKVSVKTLPAPVPLAVLLWPR